MSPSLRRRRHDQDAQIVRAEAFIVRRSVPSSGSVGPSKTGTPVSTPWNSRSGSPTWMPPSSIAELADRALVPAAPLLDDRDRLPHFALRLEVAEQDDRIGQVARVHRRRIARRSGRAGRRSGSSQRPAGEVGQQLVQLDDQEPLVGHRVQVAVQAVDDEDLDAPRFRPLRGPACANSPGDISAGSTCCTISPASTSCAKSMPRPSQRGEQGVRLSSKVKMRRRSPRSAAAVANCAATSTCRCRRGR